MSHERATGLRRIPVATAMAASLVAALAGVAADQAEDVDAVMARLPWSTIGALLALLLAAIGHFYFAGLALRHVSGRPLPAREVTYAQLAAAATNRVVPSGVGGAGLNLRYLLRAGLSGGAAARALVTLAIVGAGTDTAYVAGVTAVGPAVGVTGAGGELRRLAANGLAHGQHHMYLLAVLIGAAVVAMVLHLRGRIITTAAAAARAGAGHLRDLARRPRHLLAAAGASTGTTAVLTIGFIVAVHEWGQSTAHVPAGALIAVYWAAVAVGGATPLPAFLGLTEAARIAGLVFAGYTAGSAAAAVLIFRCLTYWLPLPVGLWAAGRLHRAALL